MREDIGSVRLLPADDVAVLLSELAEVGRREPCLAARHRHRVPFEPRHESLGPERLFVIAPSFEDRTLVARELSLFGLCRGITLPTAPAHPVSLLRLKKADPEGFEPSTAGLGGRCPILTRLRVLEAADRPAYALARTYGVGQIRTAVQASQTLEDGPGYPTTPRAIAIIS